MDLNYAGSPKFHLRSPWICPEIFPMLSQGCLLFASRLTGSHGCSEVAPRLPINYCKVALRFCPWDYTRTATVAVLGLYDDKDKGLWMNIQTSRPRKNLKEKYFTTKLLNQTEKAVNDRAFNLRANLGPTSTQPWANLTPTLGQSRANLGPASG